MVRRGEIYWLELLAGVGSEQTRRRPVVIVQNDAGNQFSPTTIVAAITSQPRRRAYPFQVSFAATESGLGRDGTVLCEQLRTIDQSRLGSQAGVLSAEKMREVDRALHLSLGLEE